MPFPGQYIVDGSGVVQSKYFENSHRERVTMQTVLIRSSDWRPESSGKVETDEFILKYKESQATIRPGNHITLILEISPKKNMHIYAPGAKGYTAISWDLKQSDLYRGGKAEFPKAEVFHMKAIKESALVFSKPFQVLQDVEIAQPPFLKKSLGDINKAAELVMEGVLRYQACDDKRCYIPKTLNLKFAFNIEGHDWVRTKARRPLKK